jgi:hypothetical protein
LLRSLEDFGLADAADILRRKLYTSRVEKTEKAEKGGRENGKTVD